MTTAGCKEKSGTGFFLFCTKNFEEIAKLSSNRNVSSLVILRQILFTGYEALPLISFSALAIGALIILQGSNILENFGQGIWVHMILVNVVINELSGILTALVVIARSGTAIATELGNMKVSREIDLIRSFGISPYSYLVVSRIIGVIVAMLLLVICFNAIAVLGGWLFSKFFSNLEFRAFMNGFLSILKLKHLLAATIKSIVFGLIISLISAFQGMSVGSASTEVPQRTIKAVVLSIFAVIFSDVIITWFFWLFQ